MAKTLVIALLLHTLLISACEEICTEYCDSLIIPGGIQSFDRTVQKVWKNCWCVIAVKLDYVKTDPPDFDSICKAMDPLWFEYTYVDFSYSLTRESIKLNCLFSQYRDTVYATPREVEMGQEILENFLFIAGFMKE